MLHVSVCAWTLLMAEATEEEVLKMIAGLRQQLSPLPFKSNSEK